MYLSNRKHKIHMVWPLVSGQLFSFRLPLLLFIPKLLSTHFKTIQIDHTNKNQPLKFFPYLQNQFPTECSHQKIPRHPISISRTPRPPPKIKISTHTHAHAHTQTHPTRGGNQYMSQPPTKSYFGSIAAGRSSTIQSLGTSRPAVLIYRRRARYELRALVSDSWTARAGRAIVGITQELLLLLRARGTRLGAAERFSVFGTVPGDFFSPAARKTDFFFSSGAGQPELLYGDWLEFRGENGLNW